MWIEVEISGCHIFSDMGNLFHFPPRFPLAWEPYQWICHQRHTAYIWNSKKKKKKTLCFDICKWEFVLTRVLCCLPPLFVCAWDDKNALKVCYVCCILYKVCIFYVLTKPCKLPTTDFPHWETCARYSAYWHIGIERDFV